MAVIFDVTGREGRRPTVVGISMNKHVSSVHYTLTMETEHARRFYKFYWLWKLLETMAAGSDLYKNNFRNVCSR